jgi:hypothetical protein
VLLLIIVWCFPATALGHYSTCKVLGRGAGLANALRTGGRLSILLCGVEAVLLSFDRYIAGSCVYTTTTSDMSLRLAITLQSHRGMRVI